MLFRSSLPAVQGVQFCSKLFDCERYSKAKNHTAEQRKQFRLEKMCIRDRYYTNPETAELAQDFLHNEPLRLLFEDRKSVV